ncbi:MAG: TSUP family transporter, partial [Clostridia bacterium]
GGGMILIPALTLLEGVEQHTAQTVNLFYFIPTAAAALIVHIKNKNVETKAALKIAAAGFVFAVAGSYMAVKLPPDMLKKIFAAFIIAAGVREIIAGLRL